MAECNRSPEGLLYTEEWPYERVVELIILKNRGMDRRDIAQTMGFSENAIIGKTHRLVQLGLLPGTPGVKRNLTRNILLNSSSETPKAPPLSEPVAPREFALPTPVIVRRGDPNSLFAGRRVAPMPKPEAKVAPYISPLRKCAWPMWGNERPSHVYCDAPVSTRSYCTVHAKIAYSRQPSWHDAA